MLLSSAKCLLRPRVRSRAKIKNGWVNYFSSEAGDGTIGASKDFLKATAKRQDPLALFPWRHEETIPPRLQEREKDFRNDWFGYDMSTYYVSTLTGKVYLDVPLFASIGQGWRKDLAEGAAWAFAEGVNEIVTNVYNEGKKASEDGDFPINFEYTHSNTLKNKKPSDDPSKENEGGTRKSLILEQKLQDLYETARQSGKDQIQVHLASKPTDAKLHSLHSLPMLSRAYAEKYPERVEEYERIRSPESRSFQHSNKFLKQMLEDTGAIETTLFAEVFVYCDEIFRVTDLQSGALLQGHDDGKIRQKILHGIRLERLISWSPGQGKTKGEWIITDIDDLLDGNRWYNPPAVGHKWWMSG